MSELATFISEAAKEEGGLDGNQGRLIDRLSNLLVNRSLSKSQVAQQNEHIAYLTQSVGNIEVAHDNEYRRRLAIGQLNAELQDEKRVLQSHVEKLRIDSHQDGEQRRSRPDVQPTSGEVIQENMRLQNMLEEADQKKEGG